MNKWDIRFLKLAQLVSTWSKDPSTGVGSVISNGKYVVSIGFNGYPQGINDNSLDSRDLKLSKTIHSEVNAIITAPYGVKGCTLYVTPFPPCDKCGALIVQSGIKRVVVGLKNDLDFSRWQKYIDIANNMFDEAKIKVEELYLND